MECCKYVGSRDSYVLFKHNPELTRLLTTDDERDRFIKDGMLTSSMRKREVAMVTARSLFRLFGALTVKNGKYIDDDYFESKSRKEAKFPPGTVVANMDLYRTINHIRSPTPSGTITPGGGSRTPAKKGRTGVQRLLNDLNRFGSEWSLPTSTGLTPLRGGTPRSRSRSHTPRPDNVDESDYSEANDNVPRRRNYACLQASLAPSHISRSIELSEEVFGYTLSAHRQIFNEPIVGSVPLQYSLAANPKRETERIRPTDHRLHSANDFNRKLRTWRQWDDSIWYDPHTGVHQVPAAKQPTRAWVERISRDDHLQAYPTFTNVDEILHFDNLTISLPNMDKTSETRIPDNHYHHNKSSHITESVGNSLDPEEDDDDTYPLALVVGQYQNKFSIYTTRFGQSVEEAEQHHEAFWSYRQAQTLGRSQAASSASSTTDMAARRNGIMNTPHNQRTIQLMSQRQSFTSPGARQGSAFQPGHFISSENGYRCGFHAKSSGKPCKRLVSQSGERCLYHQNDEEHEGVPSTPFSPQPFINHTPSTQSQQHHPYQTHPNISYPPPQPSSVSMAVYQGHRTNDARPRATRFQCTVPVIWLTDSW